MYTRILDKKIIYLDFDEIVCNNIIWGFLQINVDIARGKNKVKMHDGNDDDISNAMKMIKDYDVVVTQDFSCVVAEACNKLDKIYVSWVYDCPQRALYTKEALYDTNYVFMFDRKGVERLKQFGLKNIFFEPLAANVSQAAAVNISEEDEQRYKCDISFVGSTYFKSGIEEIIKASPYNILVEYDKAINNCFMKWNDRIGIYGSFKDEAIDYFYSKLDKNNLEKYDMGKRYLVETLFGARHLTYLERVAVINKCAEKHNIRLYTRDENVAGINAKICPPVNSENDIYKVFFLSKINLNITYRGIETGIPQRIYDIMSVGGFCLSNYQKEIPMLFKEGKDIVLFYDDYDLRNKLEYYLTHDRERVEIGINGYRTVCRLYDIGRAVSEILSVLETVINK